MNKNCLPPTAKRVQSQTNPCINNEIKNNTINRINTYKNGSTEMLNDKINELNNEWDIERIIETNAAIIVFLCSFLGLRRSKWFLITGVVGFYLLTHALQGWCLPLQFLRRMHIRTADEINIEKTAYKSARGDFAQQTDNASEMYTNAEK
ncbi:MAG: hypothetical protein A2Y15_04255 [Clostridiales bacterium GWF2_36_10]|nr:MAG: hypothetical protein A2Y15_04255 [Clostridiales bacterium GWF2_36_10]HAN20510.1 DUF2892 domain-containing protein [Clostridiales bacterium]